MFFTMDGWTLLLLLAGFALLVGGAEFLVRGAAALAADFGISPLVIGLTVVAFGTSAPELAVSVLSAWSGEGGLALGNVVGSNICNILLILGLSALAAPLVVARQVVRLEVPIMIGTSVLLVLFSLDGKVGRGEGAVLFGCALFYTIWTIRRSRRESRENGDLTDLPDGQRHPGRRAQILEILGGLVMLAVGSKWLVNGAVATARWLGVGEIVIGLTVVAVGTSLPELATSVLASLRGQRDIAVGNVVGSNIFNILVVMGLTSLVTPSGISVPPSALTFDLPIMTVVAVACLPIFFTGHRIDRWEGGLFFGYYLAYLLFLALSALAHPGLPMLTRAMVWFVFPLTMVTIAVSMIQSAKGEQVHHR